jgi:glycosyltransferase involved in cell wall biosynthesis
MPQPLLSICIPTFKRAKYLEKNLEELVRQITSDISEQVEVIVSDNCSPDNTPEVAERFKGKFSNYLSLRNIQNYGYDFNYLQCLARASGEYVWAFSDDDHFVDGSVRRLLALLKKRDVCTVVLNRSISETYPCYPAYGPRMYNVSADRKGTFLELSREFSFMSLLGLVSGMVIKRPQLDPMDWVRHMNYESALAHVTVAIESYIGLPALITNEDFLHIETPIEHVERDHQANQDPRINFKMWTLNITKFLVDCILKEIISPTESDQFYLIQHTRSTLIEHILSSFENCVSEAREISITDWNKALEFLNLTKNAEGLRRLEMLRGIQDQLLEQIYQARLSSDFRSMVHGKIQEELRNFA